jgi:hypothetical protein
LLYTYPLSGLHSGTNTVAISVASGSSGTLYLSPWVIFDAIDLVATSSLTNAPVVSSIQLTPPNPTLGFDAQQSFTATAKDQFGSVTPANFTWSTTSGSVDGTGLYTAPGAPGSATVTATSGSVSGNASVTIIDNTPLQITSAVFTYQTSQSLTFTFNKMSVSATTPHADLVLQNLTTNTTVAPVELTYSAFTGSFTASGILPDGNYRATIPAGAVQDQFGNHMAADYSLDFFVLGGDANHDRVVDISDLYVLAANFKQPGAMTFSQGDFNYDGTVDNADLAILAARWQTNLFPPPPSLLASLIAPARRAAVRPITLIS